jgi:hypothetical protein
VCHLLVRFGTQGQASTPHRLIQGEKPLARGAGETLTLRVNELPPAGESSIGLLVFGYLRIATPKTQHTSILESTRKDIILVESALAPHCQTTHPYSHPAAEINLPARR